ncbi:MAG: hypothetical protein P1V20_27350 [Verrucomicrobiales bacterium]|nr:hypothetical protein [Verrucomicrobiales bacterium]
MSAIALLFFGEAKAQDISIQAIMNAIASDSGNPGALYEKYATSLNLTLSQLSSAQLAKVFEGGVSGAGDSGSGSNAPANDPAVDQPLIDLINGGGPPGQLKNALVAASPLSEAVLTQFAGAGASLPAGIVMGVLIENAPLPDSVYQQVVGGSTSLNSGQIDTITAAQGE